MSILAKYSLWLLGILFTAAACITGASLWLERRNLTREALLRGESIALNLAAPAADAFLSRDALLQINLAASAVRDNPGLVYAALLGPGGEVVGHPDPAALMKPLDFKPEGEVSGVLARASVRAGSSGGQAVWDISIPVRLAGGKQELGSAHVGLAQAQVEMAVRSSMRVMGALSLVIMIIGLGLTFASLKVLVRPLSELSHASEAVGRGDLELSVPVRSKDEIGRLAMNFNLMIGGLKAAETAKMEQGRIEGELQLARSIQAELLPAHPPKIKGLEVAFTCRPAKELGGDFYDCIPVLGGKWGFLIADVSGKGVPAALHMANLRNLFRVLAPDHESPVEVLRRVNSMAHADMKGEAFVTLVYAVLDPATLKGRVVVAGHDPVFWIRKGGALEALDRTAPPVGLAPAEDYDSQVEESPFTMAQGDLLFTYTDGVTEAMNSAGEEFSLERVKACLNGNHGAAGAMDRVLEAVRVHADGFEQSDDITVLAVKVG